MSRDLTQGPGQLRLRLPATSANLGPGFDAAAVALDFYLDIEAEPAAEFSIAATGRDRDAAAGLRATSFLNSTGGCSKRTAVRLCRWQFG